MTTTTQTVAGLYNLKHWGTSIKKSIWGSKNFQDEHKDKKG